MLRSNALRAAGALGLAVCLAAEGCGKPDPDGRVRRSTTAATTTRTTTTPPSPLALRGPAGLATLLAANAGASLPMPPGGLAAASTPERNERWIQALYRDVLGRAGDPADVANDASALATGIAPVEIARVFLESEEARQRFVRELYTRLLGQPPADATRERLVQRLRDDEGYRAVFVDVLTSSEYQALHPGDEAWVRALYRDLLGRDGAPGEVAVHVQALLTGGARQQRVALLLDGAEHRAAFVDATFRRLLGRAPAPAERQAHEAHLAAGGRLEDVVLSLLASRDYFDRAASTPALATAMPVRQPASPASAATSTPASTSASTSTPGPAPATASTPLATNTGSTVPDGHKAQAMAILNELVTRFPVEWREAHAHIDINGRPTAISKERATAFARIVAWELHTRVSPRFGLNRKRGDPRGELSMDCFAYKRQMNDVRDVVIIDYIASAGIPSARIVWSDVSGYGPGLWEQPTAYAGAGTGTAAPGGPGGIVAPAGANTLASGASLTAGYGRISADGRYRLQFQPDGNLVLYRSNMPLWASRTSAAGGKAVMQGDGNLVIHDAGGRPVWDSKTAGNPGAHLVVQTDGNVVLYSASGTPLWHTNTAGR